MEDDMAGKIYTPDRINGMLREFEVWLAHGEKAGAIKVVPVVCTVFPRR